MNGSDLKAAFEPDPIPRSDYTYIAVLDDVSTAAVRDVQAKLAQVLGHSAYMDEWVPHVTVCFGNMLSEKELSEVRDRLAHIASVQKPIQISFSSVMIQKRQIVDDTFFSVRLKVAVNGELEELSLKIAEVARDYQVPFDVFTTDHFHVGLGRYKVENINEEPLRELIAIETLPQPIISSFSIFLSLQNNPKPASATEFFRLEFGQPI
jgi:2'-5' RNA ligase